MSSATSTPRRRERPRQSQTPAQTRQAKSFWTRSRVAIGFTAIAVTLAVALVAFSGSKPKRAPNAVLDSNLQALDGGTFRLADSEARVVVVNFWATWCGPCRSEIPHLVEMNREYKARGVEFIGLSTEDPTTSREKVRDFARQFGIDYRLGFTDRQYAALLMRDRTNIPQVFVLKDGRELNRFIGYKDSRPAELRAAIDQALKD